LNASLPTPEQLADETRWYPLQEKHAYKGKNTCFFSSVLASACRLLYLRYLLHTQTCSCLSRNRVDAREQTVAVPARLHLMFLLLLLLLSCL
jgi:hypothetical protein